MKVYTRKTTSLSKGCRNFKLIRVLVLYLFGYLSCTQMKGLFRCVHDTKEDTHVRKFSNKFGVLPAY